MGGSFSVSKPAGTQNGDLLVSCQMTWLNGGSAPAAPTGSWTALDSSFWSSGAGDYHAYYRVASGEPASYTFACGSGQNSVVIIFAVSGAATVPEGHVAFSQNGTNNILTGGLTTLLDNELLLAFFGEITATGTITATNGTDVGDVGTVNIAMDASYRTQATAGDTGSSTASTSGAPNVVGLLVSIPPASSAAVPRIIASIVRLHPAYLE
jgi:hypothetical protein